MPSPDWLTFKYDCRSYSIYQVWAAKGGFPEDCLAWQLGQEHAGQEPPGLPCGPYRSTESSPTMRKWPLGPNLF
jgi:hypothetical protein